MPRYEPWPEPDDEAEDPAAPSAGGSWRAWLASKPGTGSVLYCLAYAALGLCLSTFGPVILDLATQTGGTLQATGYCLIIRSLGYLAGSFAGFLYDYFPGHRLLSLAMALATLGTLGIPAARSSAFLAATVSLQGMAMGLIDTGANLLLLWLFKEKAGPPMQAMHCAFAVGATLGPFLENAVEAAGSSGGAGGGGATVGVGAYNAAFYIIAAFCALLSALLLSVESPTARTAQPEAAAAAPDSVSVAEGSGEEAQPKAAAGGSGEAAAVAAAAAAAAVPATEGKGALSLEGEKWRIILVTAVLLGTYVGVETGFGSYVTAYSVLQVGSSESRGQLLAGAYWAAIMVGRFASIWVASLLSNSLFLRLSMCASAACAVFLLAFGGTEGGLWAGSLGFGLAMACVYPTTLSLVETFFPVMGRHVTCIMIGSATGEMALPFVIATLFGGSSAEHGGGEGASGGGGGDGRSPQVLMWVLALACTANAGLLYVLLALGKGVQARLALLAAAPAPAAAVAA